VKSIGFTATRHLNNGRRETIEKTIKKLNADVFVHGACVGGDAYIAQMVKKHHPEAIIRAIVPANQSQVDQESIKISHEIIRMLPGSSYRDRNESIVKNSDEMYAFWTGVQAGSGTYMTINIAKRADKLKEIIYV
jgi:hypothetical protein